MATTIRTVCPECGAKLRLDESTPADESIECPKCGSVFSPGGDAIAEAPIEPAPVPKTPKPKKPKGPKKRRAKVKKTNPVFLASLLGGALVFLLVFGWLFWRLFNSSGKVEEMLTYVPADCNIARGINSGQIRKYPGYAAEIDKIVTADIKAGIQELAKAAEMSDNEMSDYVVIARARKGGATASVYVIRSAKDFDPNKLGTGLGGTAEPIDGQTTYRVGGSGGNNILAGAVVFPATKRVVVVIASGPRQSELVRGAVAGKTAAKDATFYGKCGATGAKVTSGNIWILVRSTDDMKHYAGSTGDAFAEAFKSVSDEMAKTPVFGMWTSYGAAGIRFGLALQASSPERAKELAKAMENGPLGKKDDAEIPNGMKKAYSQSGSKEFREFLSNISFTNSGDCAMVTSKMANEMGKQIAGQINSATLAVSWDFRTDAYARGKGN